MSKAYFWLRVGGPRMGCLGDYIWSLVLFFQVFALLWAFWMPSVEQFSSTMHFGSGVSVFQTKIETSESLGGNKCFLL